ncbi:unnamed protein product [Caenorhabditis auriculariae]|uniref:Uncharacterized protein n=1 Tax=Caenorhabditis auriculariae TaxID=2777116 RepID=A0A8S1HRI7_9PELO|nr:unnamed protein product [Caenorhabditis auriculariae]
MNKHTLLYELVSSLVVWEHTGVTQDGRLRIPCAVKEAADLRVTAVLCGSELSPPFPGTFFLGYPKT